MKEKASPEVKEIHKVERQSYILINVIYMYMHNNGSHVSVGEYKL